MAFAIINLKNKEHGVVKKAPVGLSWTVFFWGGFPALFRGDWKWFLVMCVASIFTIGISNIVFIFIYNKIYLTSLLEMGYASIDSKEILNPIEAKLGMTIPVLNSVASDPVAPNPVAPNPTGGSYDPTGGSYKRSYGKDSLKKE